MTARIVMTAPIAMPIIAPRGTEVPELDAASTTVTVETRPLASVVVIMRSVAVGIILLITTPFSSVVTMVRGPADAREDDGKGDREEPSLGSEPSDDSVVELVIICVAGEAVVLVRSDGVGGSGSGCGCALDGRGDGCG